MKLLNTISAITMAAMASYGCGSGGSGSASTPNGIYSGSISGGKSDFNGIETKGIIYSNRLLVLSLNADGPLQIFDGALTDSNTSLSGSGIRYDASLWVKDEDVSYDGSYVANQSATINFSQTGASSISLPSGTINLTHDTSLFSRESDASKLAGTWSGSYSATFTSLMSLTIDTNGTITFGGDQSGTLDCVLSGTITPADSSVNAYNANITSDPGASNCNLPVGDYSGLAWTEGDTDGTLVLMFTNGTNSRAVVLTKN